MDDSSNLIYIYAEPQHNIMATIEQSVHPTSILFNEKVNGSDPSEKAIIQTNGEEVHSHEETTTASTIFICNVCFMAFTTQTKWKRHCKTHIYEKPYKCDQCFEDFNVLENLLLHSSLHNKKPFRCPQCGKIFKRLTSLEGHIKSHFKSEYFSCMHCGEMFHYERRLKEHIITNHAVENTKTEKQTKSSREPKDSKSKILPCQFCGKEFKKNCLLLRHERIHKGEKPYVCDMCPQAFTQKHSLEIHRYTHSGLRPYNCDKCPQSFSQKGNLIVHIARCHGDEDASSYACKNCSCVFKKLGTLNAHISKYHAAIPVVQSNRKSIDQDDFEIMKVMQQLSELHRTDPYQVSTKERQTEVEPTLIDTAHHTDITNKSIENEAMNEVPLIELPSEQLVTWPNNGSPILIEKPSTYVTHVVSTEIPVLPHSKLDILGEDVQSIDNPFENSNLQVAEHDSNGQITYRMIQQRMHSNCRWLICLYCPKEFRRPSDLFRHMRIHTKEKPFQCPEPNCRRKFAIKSTLTVHMRIHDKNRICHTCIVCQKSFSTLRTLDEHCAINHANILLFNCEYCKLAFNTNQQLRLHCKELHKTVTKTSPAKTSVNSIVEKLNLKMADPLPLANKTYQSHDEQGVDGKSEKNIRKFSCTICCSTFKWKQHLKQHIASHWGEKPHKCHECGKAFSNGSVLKRHLFYHTKLKPFSCNQCSMSFPSAHNLQRHRLKHSEDRNFMCPYCQKKFKSKNNCRVHILVHKTELLQQIDHVGEPSITSQQLVNGEVMSDEPVTEKEANNLATDIENNQFKYILILNENKLANETNSTVLGIHDNLQYNFDDQISSNNLENEMQNSTTQESMSNEQLPQEQVTSYQAMEPESGQSSNIESTPNQQIAKHQCDLCPKSFKKPIDLKRHIRTHTGEKPYQCQICFKKFSLLSTLNTHMKTHADVKSMFPCHICWNSFATKGSLSVHMRIHSGSKPYNCEYCSLSFRTTGHQKTHMIVHLKEAKRLGLDPKAIKTRKKCSKMAPIIEALYNGDPNAVFENDNCDVQKNTNIEIQSSQPIPIVKFENQDYQFEILGCIECNVNFSNSNEMDLHMKLQHHSLNNNALQQLPQNNVCELCKKSFKKPSLLERHRLIHTKEKLYFCKTCKKCYSQKASLQAHMVIHNENHPLFLCSKCNKSFNFKSNLRSHQRTCNAEQCSHEVSVVN